MRYNSCLVSANLFQMVMAEANKKNIWKNELFPSVHGILSSMVVQFKLFHQVKMNREPNLSRSTLCVLLCVNSPSDTISMCTSKSQYQKQTASNVLIIYYSFSVHIYHNSLFFSYTENDMGLSIRVESKWIFSLSLSRSVPFFPHRFLPFEHETYERIAYTKNSSSNRIVSCRKERKEHEYMKKERKNSSNSTHTERTAIREPCTQEKEWKNTCLKGKR